MTGLLLAAGAATSGAWASPINQEPQRDVPRLEGAAASDFVTRLTPVWEATQEVRRAGPRVSPSLQGIDDEVLTQGSLLHSEVREQDVDQSLWANRLGSVRNVNGSPDIFGEAISTALRATRDAFFEGGDTASFSLAGVELSVTLRGDRRGVSLNGYDIVGTNPFTAQEAAAYKTAEPAMNQAPQEMAVRQVDDDGLLTLADVRRFVTDPMAIMVVLALLGMWVVLAIASRTRS